MDLRVDGDTGAVEILTRQASEEVLRRNEIGRLGCFSPGADETYIVPISYRYRGGAIYFACLPGQKLRYIKEHPQGVCLEVEEVDAAHQWLTVIAIGHVSEASGREQVEEAFPTLRRVSRGPLRAQFSGSSSPQSMADLVFCVLRPSSISGRKDRWSRDLTPAPRPPIQVHPLAGHLAG